MSRFIKNCRKKFTILKDDYRRKHPPKHAGNEIYGLGAKQVYPHGINFDECLMLGVKDDFNNIHFTSKTPVASIGTCFAEELSRHLNTIKFNYVHTEDNIWGASANWGRVYTVPNLCQIFHYSFEASFPLTIEYSKSRSMKKKELGFF